MVSFAGRSSSRRRPGRSPVQGVCLSRQLADRLVLKPEIVDEVVEVVRDANLEKTSIIWILDNAWLLQVFAGFGEFRHRNV
jgi:hypothetical protein